MYIYSAHIMALLCLFQADIVVYIVIAAFYQLKDILCQVIIERDRY